MTILEGAVEGTIQSILPPAIEHAAWEVHVDEQEKITMIVYKINQYD